MTILGIDEAGRGSIIGSLFVAGAAFNEKDLDKLKKMGVKDSKLLTHKKRVELCKKIEKLSKKFVVIRVSPQEIDDALLNQSKMNLNWLEAVKTAEIINDIKPKKAIIDCPSPNVPAYRRYISKLLEEQDTELIVEHKADVKYIASAAASILAKCGREEEVEKLQKKYGEIGPGYPSNEITKAFVEKNWEKHPEIFRKSWRTYKNVKGKKNQKSLNEF